MRILLNGESVEILKTDLDEALLELGYNSAVVATALNGEFVPVTLRAGTNLEPGDSIEVLAPMQGG